MLSCFVKMIPPSILTFDPQELEWLIAGQVQVDLSDWKENTVYWGEHLLELVLYCIVGRDLLELLLHCIL